ncbi:hypothetical protein BP6252_08393 [Coleophoma cylindrospora]|uniref:Major facilitator superfamily (MFS) profile domain-containing protein n=1 Tax=Coleophoma cylindrospora TaxID=1849047 RepID=A0A3D8R5R5_9HELO|nr:hypothetical protein BP6252_08393 [Coleophoma cylindrospora]
MGIHTVDYFEEDGPFTKDIALERFSLEPILSKADESKKSTWEMIKIYKTAVLASTFIGLAAINWGMDGLLSAGVIAVPSFQRDFGDPFGTGFLISSNWQIAFNTVPSLGGLMGSIATGIMADRVGKRVTLGAACMMSIIAVFVQVFAPGRWILLLGKFINGFPLGAFLTIASSYAAEVCPVEIRGLTTSGVQLFVGFGQFLANLVLKGTGTLDSTLAYKIPFALQFFFPIIIIIGLPFCPETPWYLLRKGLPNNAIMSLARLGFPSPATTLAEMQKTIENEAKTQGSTSYMDCFRGSDLRRTEVAMGVFSVAQFTGVVFVIGYSSFFFELAGLSASSSFSLSLSVTVLGLCGVVSSWFLINSAGRRSLLFVGNTILVGLLAIVGILDIIPVAPGTTTAVYGQVAGIIAFAFVYFISVGPVGWALFAEISSARLRSRTVGLGIVVQNVFGIGLNVLMPILINPDALNLKGKIGFIFAITAGLSSVWIYFRVPETAQKSFEDLDNMFEQGVSARKSKGWKSQVEHVD